MFVIFVSEFIKQEYYSFRLAVSCDSSVHLWDPFVGDKVEQLETPKYTPVNIVKAYPASSIVLAGTSEATIKMIDARMFSYVNEWKVSRNTEKLIP